MVEVCVYKGPISTLKLTDYNINDHIFTTACARF